VLCAVCAYCGSQSPTGPSPTPPPSSPVPQDPPVTPPPPPIPSGPQVFVGAGDIAMCDRNAEDTARLLDGIGGTVFSLGDSAYFQGNAQNFRDCYEPTWGRHKGRTRPVPGNHEYETPGADPYYTYFGVSAGPRGQGYYSFELGDWHAIALNSQIPVGAGSAQEAWLRSDLAANRALCTIAYWHYPFFTSGPNGRFLEMRDFWRALYEAGADIILSAHDHLYERFAPQDPDGRPDPARGIRQFIVGTGGALMYQAGAATANSEVRSSNFGVLKLTLSSDRYQWEFIPVSGPPDSGSGVCH
jgi:hypothetical protein